MLERGALLSSFVPALALASACSSAVTSSAPSPSPDASAGTGQADGGAPASRPPPVFLEPTAYGELLRIDAAFPFDVTSLHLTSAPVAGSHWGRHGGPLLTTSVYGAGGGKVPTVIRWSLDPASPTAPATREDLPLAIAPDLPETRFYGADGMVDLPFGPWSLLSYTGSTAAFPGEALLYSDGYGAVRSRARVNGFYSGAGVADGDRHILVYSGLSPLAAAASTTDDNGLYASDVCEGALLGAPPCRPAKKLFGWSGASGPVVTDHAGNVFVGAAVAGGSASDAVYAVARAAVVAGNAEHVALAQVDAGGTASLAAVAPDVQVGYPGAGGTPPGWVLGHGYADGSPIYAAPYLDDGATLSSAGALVPAAITRAKGVSAISLFTDAEGDLWLALTTGKTGAFVELRRKAP